MSHAHTTTAQLEQCEETVRKMLEQIRALEARVAALEGAHQPQISIPTKSQKKEADLSFSERMAMQRALAQLYGTTVRYDGRHFIGAGSSGVFGKDALSKARAMLATR
jgi:hypothetical protein